MHPTGAGYVSGRPFGSARWPSRGYGAEPAREPRDELESSRARSPASGSGSWAADPANPWRGEERVAQRLVAIERVRQREDDAFGARPVILCRRVVLHAAREVGARGMDSPARRRDVE